MDHSMASRGAVPRILALCLLSALLCPVSSGLAVKTADEQENDPWDALRVFVGTWTGTTEGKPGSGTVERTYEFILGGSYLLERNVSTYPPQKANPEGETHRHWSLFSFDRDRKRLVLRQFHDEGFVNQYVMADDSSKARFAFNSEHFENFPNQWGARESYEILSENEFVETFELAPPGKPYRVFSRNHFTRTE